VLTFVGKMLRGATVLAAYLYLAGIIGFTLFVRCYATDSWFSALCLYLPRHVFLLPVPCLALLLILAKRRSVLWTQWLSLGVVLFPLMGLRLPDPPSVRAEATTLRVLSFNVDSGYAGVTRIVDAIVRSDADIVAIQEAKGATSELRAALARHYRHVEEHPYSLLASRYPIVEATVHERIAIAPAPRSPRFQRHVVDLPTGKLAFYNVHPISPRGALNIHRFRGALGAFSSGQAINQESISALEYNTQLRRLQIEAVSRLARAEPYPVILAGDFNLPYSSQVFHANLDSFQDGFAVAGAGFGYTFPARFPWMRLDRVLASYPLRIVGFDVDCAGLSDHRCVFAEVRLR